MRDEIKLLAHVFALLANKMDHYAGDLFYDFPRALERFTDPDLEWPVVFMHKTHADLSDRYERILIEEGKRHGLEECVKCCQETLGMDFMISIAPSHIIITNFRADNDSIRDLVSRLRDYGMYASNSSITVIDRTQE